MLKERLIKGGVKYTGYFLRILAINVKKRSFYRTMDSLILILSAIQQSKLE